MKRKFKFSASGQTKLERLYAATRTIAATLAGRVKTNARCRSCFNTRRGCDGCSEVFSFLMEIESIFAEPEVAQ